MNFIKKFLVRSGQPGRNLLNFLAIILSLKVGLPAAVSIFEPISSNKAIDCEPEIQNQNHNGVVYFSKGL